MDSANEREIREKLRNNSPFFSGSAKDPWENEEPDVEALNHGAYEYICALARAKNQSPGEPLAALVIGESGMGKTHLLKRLLQYTQDDGDVIFVSVRPFLDPEKSMRHLLSEIVVNLSMARTRNKSDISLFSPEEKKNVTQFDYFFERIMRRYKESNKDMAVFISKERLGLVSTNWNSYFKGKYPRIQKNVLEALFLYRDAGKQNLILNWLGGNVHEDYEPILRFPDRASMAEPALEAEAYGIIDSLGLLLRDCGMSMIVCFDQLDGMKDQGLIDAFGNAVNKLVNEVNSMLPLAFARSTTWAERFSSLDPAPRERLAGNTILLKGCTIGQARDLIRVRVKSRFPNDTEEMTRWLMGRLDGKLIEGESPREIIMLANSVVMQTFQTPVKEDELTDAGIIKTVKREYSQERDNVASDFKMWPPNAAHMSLALTSYLKSHPEYDAIQPGPNKFITLVGKFQNTNEDRVDCAFIINTAEHPMTVQACFNHGMKFLQDHSNAYCYYISDERCAFRDEKRWPKVHQVKNEFKKLRGRTILLNKIQAVTWYGLVSLIFKLENGDVSLGPRAASEKDLELYMKNGFEEKLLPSPHRMDDAPEEPPPSPPSPPADTSSVEKKIIGILKTSPMRMLTIPLLIGKLQVENVKIVHEQLLELLGGRKEKFSLYPSGDGTLVMLK